MLRRLPPEVTMIRVAVLLQVALLAAGPAFAQRLVDPATVAPEFREAAEKRRAEQLKQRECHQKADAEKVSPRDRTSFLAHCIGS
jgi:hypothetical protein